MAKLQMDNKDKLTKLVTPNVPPYSYEGVRRDDYSGDCCEMANELGFVSFSFKLLL